MENKIEEIHKNLEDKKYTLNHCFLCGCELNESNQSMEHVIPKWVQNKYNLWNQKLELTNGTKIMYRNLTIPCCSTCNGIHLSMLEKKIQASIESGFDKFKLHNKQEIFYWIGKIFYGLYYKELFLLKDRKQCKKGSILNKEVIYNQFSEIMYHLQGILKNIQYSSYFPASIFIFNVKPYEKKESNWFLFDNIFVQGISIQMGDIGIIAFLNDSSIMKEYTEAVPLPVNFNRVKLHPFQFKEVIAQYFYKADLLKEKYKYQIIQHNEIIEFQKFGNINYDNVFSDWILDDYIDIARYILKKTKEEMYFNEKQYTTWLTRNDGSFNEMFLE